MRIYIESTIPSYAVARPSRDMYQAVRQQMTRDWWQTGRSGHNLYISELVIDEVSLGEPEMANRRLALLRDLEQLDPTDRVLDLAEHILKSGLLPSTADADATHIALATVHRVDYLLTWNLRHIANPAIQARLRKLVESWGYLLPVICSPEALLGAENDQ